MNQVLTVELPSELYVRIKERAEHAKRSIEQEAVEMLAATAGSFSVEQTIQERFQRLADVWHKAVAHLSSSSKRESHPAYQEIIAMGPGVVPCMLRDLETSRRHWFTALTVITGVNPVAEADSGSIPKMIDAWIRWGKSKGYRW